MMIHPMNGCDSLYAGFRWQALIPGWIPVNVPHSEAIAMEPTRIVMVDPDYAHSNSDGDSNSDSDSDGARLTYRIMAGTRYKSWSPAR